MKTHQVFLIIGAIHQAAGCICASIGRTNFAIIEIILAIVFTIGSMLIESWSKEKAK